MLGHNTLIFPTLVYDRETTFKNEKEITIFKLSWHTKEFKYHETAGSSEDTDFITALPEPYDIWATDLQFALTKNYLEEIKECAKSANHRWKSYPFDTIIREICLEPSITFIWTAFRLLADCVYSQEDNYFDRSSKNILVQYALCYKFWRNQTGIGLVKSHSNFDKLERTFKNMLDGKFISGTQDKISIIDDFFGAIRKHEEIIEENHTKKYSFNSTHNVIGPVK